MSKYIGDDIRGIIGSFYPVRPILTNKEIYEKILEINPEFSIVRLLERYKKWHENRMEEGELYKQLMKLEFNASGPSGDSHDYLQIHSVKHVDEICKLLDVSPQYGSNTIYVYEEPIRTQLKELLIQYINNELCNPSVTRPLYNDGYMLQYTHIQEELGEGMVNNIDEYVNKIKEYDSHFSLTKVYYKLSTQYKIAKQLDEKYITMIGSILPRLTLIQYINQNIYFYDERGMDLLTIENANENLFQSVIANLYHGINSAEIELHNRYKLIEVDTYPSNITY